jgi:hypothetical protein
MEAKTTKWGILMQTEKISTIHSDLQNQILSGTIESLDDLGYRIVSEAGHFVGSRAFSCVVEPQLADTILFISLGSARQCHILSIIERPDSTDTHLSFPGNVSLTSQQGELSLNGSRGINMSSLQSLNVITEEVNLVAKKGLLNIDNLKAVGTRIVAKITNVQTFAHTLETVAEHWLQKLKNSFRQIEGVDQLKTKDSIHTVQNLYSMRAKQAAILAKKDIKIDAERIHMG